jgi:hypothetical protein
MNSVHGAFALEAAHELISARKAAVATVERTIAASAQKASR